MIISSDQHGLHRPWLVAFNDCLSPLYSDVAQLNFGKAMHRPSDAVSQKFTINGASEMVGLSVIDAP
jgi:hypothetical protein